jgi:ribonuclease VapC
MSAVNLGEVLYRLWSQLGEMEGEQRFRRFRLLPIDIVPARERLALDAARLKARHRLGYADAFAVATARDADASLLTGDPELLALPRAVVKTLRLDR